jgi:uncharacterized SAM-binding protein YcdF (DUF218 family)
LDVKSISAIIVLGNPPKKDGTIPYNLRTRLDLAIKEYWRKSPCRLLLTGGAVYGKHVEAVSMKEYCISNGIPDQDIMLETKSRSTYDNALLTAEILDHTEHQSEKNFLRIDFV